MAAIVAEISSSGYAIDNLLSRLTWMLPLTDPATLFEELLPDLPAASVQMARACKALVRAKKVKPPAQLLRVGCFYGGWDNPLRAVAGTFTAR